MTDLITQFGPLGVFLLMLPESACIPIPSELTLLAAGFAVREHWMTFGAAVAAATAGNVAGSLIAYALGRAAASHEPPHWARRGLARCDAIFARHGVRAVFVARLMPLARTFVSLPAGHARVPIGPFALMTTAGCAVWAAGFALLGLLLGSAWSAAGDAVGDPLLALGALATVAALARAGTRKR